MMSNKEHLTSEGMQSLINTRASMNLGLTVSLKEAFPLTVAVKRPLMENQVIPHPEWLAGFTTGEGCFLIRIGKATTNVGFKVELVFKLTQHTRDEQLMKNIQGYFGSLNPENEGKEGSVGKYYTRADHGDFLVTKLSDLTTNIIPFFKKHLILGVKAQDFEDFCEVAKLMKDKKHLTLSGFDQIREIKEGMNRGRKVSKDSLTKKPSLYPLAQKRTFSSSTKKPLFIGLHLRRDRLN